MSVHLTKLQWIAVIGSVSICLLGGGGYFYASYVLTEAQQDLATAIQQRDRLVHSPIFPSESNIKVLHDNNIILEGAINALNARLRTPDNKLKDVKQKNPILFKTDLMEMQKKLTAEAKTHDIVIPPNYSFGFGRYNSITPLDRNTVFLGKQLIAVDEIISQLFQSQISQLLAVRRTFVEVPGLHPGSAGYDPSGELLHANSFEVADGIYRVYPFELDFLGSPTSLRNFLNRLNNSPYIFVVRSIQINSTKPEPVHLEDLERQSNASNSNGTGTAPDAPVSPVAKPPLRAVGFENVQFTVRLDLIEWTGHAKPNEHGKSMPAKS